MSCEVAPAEVGKLDGLSPAAQHTSTVMFVSGREGRTCQYEQGSPTLGMPMALVPYFVCPLIGHYSWVLSLPVAAGNASAFFVFLLQHSVETAKEIYMC